jgi:sugar phosphate isomerase/epimerase
MLRLSMNELTTMRWSFEEDVAEFAQAGFDGIGIWRQKLSDVGEANGSKLLQRHGIRCSNLLWAGGFTGSDGLSFRDSVTDAIEAIRTAANISASCLVLYSGAWGGHTRSHARRIVKNALAELLPFAEEFGIPLAIEPMHAGCGGAWTFLNSVDETLELIDPFENPFLKIALDTYHIGMQDPNLQQLSEIVHRVAIVHVGDGHEAPDGEQDRCPLGNGCVPIRPIIDTLVQTGYEGFLDIELIGESVEQFDYPTLLRKSRNYLNALFATM